MSYNTDWRGNQIPPDEPDDALIKVWEVTPHPQSIDYDCMWERSYQKMMDTVANNLDDLLDRVETRDLEDEGTSIRLRLITMRKSEYLAAGGA